MTTIEVISIIVGIILGLITIFAMISKPIINLTKTIAVLNEHMQNMQTDFEDFENDNNIAHGNIWKHNKKQDEILNRHEINIRLIQNEIGKDFDVEVKHD